MDRQKLYQEIQELLKEKGNVNLLPFLSNEALNELEKIMKKSGTDVFDWQRDFEKLTKRSQDEILKTYDEQRGIIQAD